MAVSLPERILIMTKKQKEKILATIRKKDNMSYWDEIDDEVLNFVLKLAKYSYAKVKCYYEEEDEDFDFEDVDESELEVMDEIMWLADDVRDFVIKKLEKNFKAWFPYVEENIE